MEHSHCKSCVLVRCKVVAEDGCRVEECPNKCGAKLHACKTEEHVLNTCPDALVPCLNAQYGCKENLKRVLLGFHLEHCPASVLACKFAHERQAGAEIPAPTIPDGEESGLYLDELWSKGDTLTAHTPPEEGVAHYSRTDFTVPPIPTDFNLSLKYTSGFHGQYVPLHAGKKVCVHDSPGSRHNRLHCRFPCHEVVRRDEFAAHYKSLHHDIQVHLSELFNRCPMHSVEFAECTYQQQRLLPEPKGSTLRYDVENSLFMLKHPEVVDCTMEAQTSSQYAAEIQKKQELALYGYADEEEESYDVLGQLPPEVLGKICSHLDSLSLWYLAQVNHYLRNVCQHVAKKRGIVHQVWNFDESSRTWTQAPKMWSFSRVMSGIQSWYYADRPPIGNHMRSCEHCRREPYNPGELWALFMLTDRPDFCGIVSQEEVNFR